MGNTFIATASGFVKGKTRNEKYEVIIHYTDKLRDALTFTSKGKAHRFMETHKLQGFTYNPWEQEPIKDKYKVVDKNRANYWNRIPNPGVVYAPELQTMLSNSDAYFIAHKNNAGHDLLSLEEATAKAKELNQTHVDALVRAINGEPDPKPVTESAHVDMFSHLHPDNDYENWGDDR